MGFKELISSPEFYDIFGVGIFTYLLIIGAWMFFSKRKLPKWVSITLILIGIAGLIVDGIIVFTKFIK